MFKKGDFVKVRANTELVSGEIVNDWAGEITKVYRGEKTALVILDAATINSLDDAYLESCIEEGAEPFEYIFGCDDLEKSTRRDTDIEQMAALDGLASRMIKLEGDEEAIYFEQSDQWIKAFTQSSQYQELMETEQGNADFVLETFMDYMYNYLGITPRDWTPAAIDEICLEIAPRKISAEQELFESYGPVLIQFLAFLDAEHYLKNTKRLITAVRKIKDRIPLEANNPSNWGMAKIMMMSAHSEGIDTSNQEELDRFLRAHQLKSLSRLGAGNPIKKPEDPYRKLGRNQKITVKYQDGRVVENIKFKKVASDLRNGLCELIRQ